MSRGNDPGPFTLCPSQKLSDELGVGDLEGLLGEPSRRAERIGQGLEVEASVLLDRELAEPLEPVALGEGVEVDQVTRQSAAEERELLSAASSSDASTAPMVVISTG